MEGAQQSFFNILQIFQELSKGDKKEAVSSSAIKVLDTIFFDKSGEIYWYFTTKNGSISRKKTPGTATEVEQSITDRFCKFALANPYNKDGYIGQIIDSYGSRVSLIDTEIRDFLTNNRDKLIDSASYLQVFLRPRRGEDVNIIYQMTRKGDSISASMYLRSAITGATESFDEPEVVDQVNDLMSHITALITKKGLAIDNAVFEFTIDDNNHVWLSYVPQCECTVVAAALPKKSLPELKGNVKPVPPPVVSQANADGNHGNSNSNNNNSNSNNSNINNISNSNSNNNNANISRPSSGNKSGKGGQTTDTSSSANINNNENRPSTADILSLVRGSEFLFRDAKGEFRSKLAKEDLPGLVAWEPLSASGSSKAKDNLAWAVNLNAFSTIGEAGGDYQVLGSVRSPLPLKMLAFIRNSENILLGNVAFQDIEQFEKAWKTEYDRYLSETVYMNNANDSVIVCGNIFNISKKLESLIQAGFVGMKTSSRPVSGQQRRVLSAGNVDRAGGVVVPAATSSSTKLETKTAFEDEGAKKARAQKGSEIAAASKGISNSKIPKREDKDKSVPPGKKPGAFDQPPNIDLIAKFALEKEKLRSNSENVQSENIDDNANNNDILHGPIAESVAAKNSKFSNKSKVAGSKGKAPIDALAAHESKLSQLEKAANDNWNLQKQFLNPYAAMQGGGGGGNLNIYGPAGLNNSMISSGNSIISQTEADFMQRAMQSGDVSILGNGDMDSIIMPPSVSSNIMGTAAYPAQNNISNNNYINNNNNSNNNNASFSGSNVAVNNNSASSKQDSKITAILKERVESLDKELAHSKQTLLYREEDLAGKDKRIKELTLKFDQFRKDKSTEIRDLTSDYEFKLNSLKDEHAKELAIIAFKESKEGMPENRKGTMEAKIGDMFGSKPAQASKTSTQLLEQIEQLRQENRKQNDSFAEERRNYQVELNMKMIAQERQFKADLTELRSLNVKLEDQIAVFREEVVSYRGQVQHLEALNRTVEQHKQDAIDAAAKTRADLKNMQQSLQSSYRMDASNTLNSNLIKGTADANQMPNGVMDVETLMKINDAKIDAKTRQLNNKVEFLKSQLAAEQMSNEDLKRSADAVRVKMDEMRQEMRIALQEAEQVKVQSIAEAEQRLEAIYTDRMQELTTLQSKLMMTQNQLQEAFQETALVKQREEYSKSQVSKNQMQQNLLRTEIENLRNQLKELREQRQQDDANEVARTQNEGMIRRLENERVYLKNQLASEITLKNEVTKAFSDAQQQINDIKKQWKEDVDTLKERNRVETQDSLSMEQKLQQQIVYFENTNQHLSSQTIELKETVIKMRDQIRIEQLANEDAKTTNRRLNEQLDLMKVEHARLKNIEDSMLGHHNQEVQTMKNAMIQLEREKNAEMAVMKESLSRQFVKQSNAQNETIDLRQKYEMKEKDIHRTYGSVTIVKMLEKMKLTKLFVKFRVWQRNTTLMKVASQFRGQMERIIKENADDFDKEKTTALSELRMALDAERLRNLDNQHNINLREIDALKASFEEEKSELSEQMHQEFHEHMKGVEKKWSDEMNEMRASTDKYLEEMNIKKDKRIDEILKKAKYDADAAALEAQRVLELKMTSLTEEMRSEAAVQLQVRESELVMFNDSEKKRICDDYELKLKRQKEASDLKFQTISKENSAYLVATENKLMEKNQKDLAALRAEMEEEKSDALYDLQGKHEKDLSVQRQEMYELMETRAKELRKDFDQELLDQLAAKEDDFKELLSKRMDEYAKSVEAERARGIKLEASKWRQALKEAEKRYELELSKAKEESKKDVRFELEEEIRLREIQNNLKAAKLEQQNKQAMDDVMVSHQLELQKMKNANDVAQKHAVSQAEGRMRDMCGREWEEKLDTAVKNAWKDANEIWQARMDKEKDILEALKRDINKQSEFLAAERNELREKLNNSDDNIKKIENMYKAEQLALLKDRDTERDLLAKKTSDIKDALTKQLKEEHAMAMELLEQRYKEDSDTRDKRTTQSITDKFDVQMVQLQGESEKLISSLESALTDLRREKNALADALDKTTTKLEDTEDSLYDVQQTLKKKEKNHSLDMWKTLTAMQRMKNRFAAGMKEFDKEKFEAIDKVKRQLSNDIFEYMVAAMKMTVIFQEIEEARKKIHQVLVSYRTDELVDKRGRVRLIEKEIERLLVERDSLEEQRDHLEEDIENLELKVQDYEEQIRIHNKSSSMENGRVNVAHAKKKRRLDSELEAVLEQIDTKRQQINDIDKRVSEKSRQRDEKEADMIDLEKVLVSILLEQQRTVLSELDGIRQGEDKFRVVVHVCQLPYPPPPNPTSKDAKQIYDEAHSKTDGDGK